MARRHLEIPRPKIDARPINEESTRLGVKGAHRGMGGELIGGYMPLVDGSMKAFGTKERGASSNSLGKGLGRWYELNQPESVGTTEAEAPETAQATRPKSLFNPVVGPQKGTGDLMKVDTPAAPAAPAPAQNDQVASESGLDRWHRMNPHAKSGVAYDHRYEQNRGVKPNGPDAVPQPESAAPKGTAIVSAEKIPRAGRRALNNPMA